MRPLAIARFSLEDYIRSGSLLVEVVAVLALHVVFFKYQASTFGADTAHFFGVLSVFTLAQAVYTTAMLFRRAATPRAYVVLARLAQPGLYVRGKLLAALVITLTLYLGTLARVVAQRIVWETPDRLALGSGAVLLNALVALTLTGLFSPLVTPRLARVGLFSVLALAGGRLSIRASLWERLSQPFSLLVSPVFNLHRFAVEGTADPLTWLAVAVSLLIVVGGWWVAEWRFSQREVML